MGRRHDKYPIEPNENETYTIDFSSKEGIDGVSTPRADFSRARRAVAEMDGTDSPLYNLFDEDEQSLTVTPQQLREITSVMKQYEEQEAGFGEDKLIYESRTRLNQLRPFE